MTIYHSDKGSFYKQLFFKTGSEGHISKVLKKTKGSVPVTSETAIYEKAKLPFIFPEMREDLAEWSFKRRKEHLVTVNDITGVVVHNHTDWSDGVDSLEAIVTACKKKGYQYCVVSDHSKKAYYAGGLKENDVLDQIASIEALNNKLAPFRIFTSIECDILVSGELDYGADLLGALDMVIVSGTNY